MPLPILMTHPPVGIFALAGGYSDTLTQPVPRFVEIIMPRGSEVIFRFWYPRNDSPAHIETGSSYSFIEVPF